MRHNWSGTCRLCGCTEMQRCTTPTGEPCYWFSADRTVCSNPPCVRRFTGELAQQKSDAQKRSRKKSPGEIHDLIRGKGRRR